MPGLCFLRWPYIFICFFQASQNVFSHLVKLVVKGKAQKVITILGLVLPKECSRRFLFII